VSYKLGGRLYQPINLVARTFRSDAAATALINELGLDEITLGPLEDEDLVAYAGRLNHRVIATGRIPDLLGHYLIPVGKTETDWTPELAAETAAIIGAVQDPQERDLVYQLASEFVFFFFRSALQRLAISQSSTAASRESLPSPESSAASSRPPMASGRRSSDTLQRETMLGRFPSWVRGLFGRG